jgi:hypothetical protein
MSVKVIVSQGKPIDQFMLNKGVTSIGRKSDCDISIKDPAVSGTHAQIQKVGLNYLIQDLNSTNGVHVNGRPIKQYLIKNEDIVTIGEHQLKFIISDAAVTELKPQKKIADPTHADTSHSGFLKVLSGSDVGNVVHLQDGLTTIGIPGVQVAAVSKRPQGHFIIHVDGGKNKSRVPLVNDEPIGFRSKKLELGDKILVADIKMEYVVGKIKMVDAL